VFSAQVIVLPNKKLCTHAFATYAHLDIYIWIVGSRFNMWANLTSGNPYHLKILFTWIPITYIMLASSLKFNTYIGIEQHVHVSSPRVAKNQYVEHLTLMANYCYCHAPHTSQEFLYAKKESNWLSIQIMNVEWES